MPTTPPTPDPTPPNLQRLEEAALFAEHRADRMDEAIRSLDAAVQRLIQRVESLERRLLEFDEPSAKEEPADDQESGSI